MAITPYSTAPEISFWSRGVARRFDAAAMLPQGALVLRRGDRVMSAGSCFAANIVQYEANWPRQAMNEWGAHTAGDGSRDTAGDGSRHTAEGVNSVELPGSVTSRTGQSPGRWGLGTRATAGHGAFGFSHRARNIAMGRDQ